MSLDELLRDRKVWETKEVLRLVYTRQFFPRLSQNRVPGFRTVEVGAGPGLYKQFAPDVLSSDITVCPWHDLAANGEHLPFAAASLDNVIGLDVVHHLNNPLSFFCESARVLRAAGRVVLIEPWMGHRRSRGLCREAGCGGVRGRTPRGGQSYRGREGEEQACGVGEEVR